MNKVQAIFNYAEVKKAVRLYYKNSKIKFDELDFLNDSESSIFYLDMFANMLEQYGVINETVMLVNTKNGG